MIKIRAMGTRELKQVLSLLARFTNEEFEYRILENFRQLYIPIQRFSQMLPPRWQFVPAIYVAISQKKVLGLIWLSQDGRKTSRWKIDQLIIDPEDFSYDVGTQLVNYVINRYGAEGIQTFLALVHHQYEKALGLLKTCGFRHVTRLHAFCHEKPGDLNLTGSKITGLRESTSHDRFKLKELHEDTLPTDKRIALERSACDFNRPLWRVCSDRLKGVFFKRWVVEDPVHDLLIGSVAIHTENYKDFHLEILTSPGWEDGYWELLAFSVAHVLQQTQNARIYLNVYAFYRERLEQIQQLGFSRLHEAEVLVKDYWVPLEDKPEQSRSPVLLFAGKTSTAWGR